MLLSLLATASFGDAQSDWVRDTFVEGCIEARISAKKAQVVEPSEIDAKRMGLKDAGTLRVYRLAHKRKSYLVSAEFESRSDGLEGQCGLFTTGLSPTKMRNAIFSYPPLLASYPAGVPMTGSVQGGVHYSRNYRYEIAYGRRAGYTFAILTSFDEASALRRLEGARLMGRCFPAKTKTGECSPSKIDEARSLMRSYIDQ